MGNRRNKNSHSDFAMIRSIVGNNKSKIHFVGIGGVSMSSLAGLTLLYGVTVSGSDRSDNERIRDLGLHGIRVTIGHFTESVKSADLVVYSHAISKDNPELCEAFRLGIPTVSRAEYLGALMLDYHSRIGVSGSHGKSTTVAMLDRIFSDAALTPTVLSGADLPIGSPVRLGSNGVLIYEACEYRDSFLHFSPSISIGLNLEMDHTDYFPDIDSLRDSFTRALGRASNFTLINGDDDNFSYIIKKIKSSVITFGSGEKNDYRYSITAFREIGYEFALSRYGSIIARFELNIPGVFNVHNAAAAIIVAIEYGIGINVISDAIKQFKGIAGRLEFVGNRYGRKVFSDYAHHPTEILASINAIKEMTGEPITVVFKPHTFSRTEALWNDFCHSLSQADYLILTDVYPAREQPIEGINSERLATEIGGGAKYSKDDDVVGLIDRATLGSILLMGAGDLSKIKNEILNKQELL